MPRFDGKAVLVTGAAQGMGRAIAERFLEAGAAVAIFDLDADLVAETAKELGATGKVVAVAGDVARREDVRRACDTCVAELGSLDVLAAQAGIGDLCPLLEIDDARWQRMIDVNLTGVFLCLHHQIPHLLGPYEIAEIAIDAAIGSPAHDLRLVQRDQRRDVRSSVADDERL